MVRQVGVVSGVAAALLLAACSGSTEPATDVTSGGATLNARGTADNGPAFSFFEYGPSGVSGAQRQTTRRSWPANVSGPIREAVAPLYAGTTYAFRICGNDQGKAAVCAQTRTFTTPAAARDAVRGGWLLGPSGSPHSVTGRVDASTLGFRTTAGSTLYFDGDVTCLQVAGRRAAVGAVGRVMEATNGATHPATALVTVLDGGPGQLDRVRQTYAFGSAPPSCPAAGDPTASDETAFDGLVVYDAR